ncbi:uncharacterized protein [Amphiura filiformis]|uniref:uncharacterized protein n=1 Tax=Amphiura filiformis TaxID=82378 RepID=UPI003B21DF8E
MNSPANMLLANQIPSKIAAMTDTWTWLRLKAAKDRMLQLKTRGQPATIQQVTIPRKTSEEVTAAYRHQRSKSIATYRNLVSKGADQCQLEDEVSKYVTKLDVDSSLAMMKDMQASWQALRDQRRYLKVLKTGMASENAMLARREEILDNNITAEMVPMVHTCDTAEGKSGYQTKPTPMVYTRSLNALVSSHLDAHEKLGNLHWHDGLIPSKEIWIKIGADKGGKPISTMKFNFQIVNVKEPNS